MGQEEPDVSEKATKAFPCYPIAISKGVPFFLVGGFTGSGFSGATSRCLPDCETLPLIDKDLPTGGYAEAAKLVASDEFKALYPDEKTRKEMAGMIAEQAGKKK